MKRTWKEWVAVVLSFIFIVAIYYLVIDFDKHASEVVTNSGSVVNIEQMGVKLSDNKVQELQEYYDNTDIKGIVTIEGLNDFSYPVAQTSNNEYYLNHNYYKEYDKYGAIYADYRVDLDNSKKILIFGHSSTKRDVPFNELENYEIQDYYNEHKYITLETKTNSYRYEIFSVYVETSDFTYMNMNFDSEENWYKHLLKLQNKSMYSKDIEIDADDEILILQTCSNNSKYQKYSKKYLLIVSRRVK